MDHNAPDLHNQPATPATPPAATPSISLIRRKRLYLLLSALILVSLAGVFLFNVIRAPAHGTRISNGTTSSTATTAATTTATSTSEIPNTDWVKLWTPPQLSTPTPDQYLPLIPSLAWSPADPQTLYFCRSSQSSTVNGQPQPPIAQLFYRSTDLGVTWQQLTLPEPAASCTVQPDAAVAGMLVLQDDRGGSYLSRDRGATWQPIPTSPNLSPSLSQYGLPAFTAGGRVYVGAFWSTDLHSWQQWYTGPNASTFQGPMAVNPQRPNTIYAQRTGCPGAPTSPQWANTGVCRSDDGGHTWRFLIALANQPGSQPGFCLSPANPDLLFAWGGGQIARSLDGGATWAPVALAQQMPPAAADAPCLPRMPYFSTDGYVLADDGTLYHAGPAPVSQQYGNTPWPTIPTGISVLGANRSWRQVAPYPLQNATAGDINPQVLSLMPAPGQHVLFAFSFTSIYRYTGPFSV